MLFINFIFENIIYIILFVLLLSLFIGCKEYTVKIVFSLILFLYFSAFAVYTYIFAVGKIAEKINVEKGTKKNPMNDVIQIVENY